MGWRQGYIRVPKTCSADTPADECVASCPDDIIRGRSADKILEESGVKEIWNEANSNTVNLDDTALSAFDIDTATILDGLCRVGYAGELFTSAAPGPHLLDHARELGAVPEPCAPHEDRGHSRLQRRLDLRAQSHRKRHGHRLRLGGRGGHGAAHVHDGNVPRPPRRRRAAVQ